MNWYKKASRAIPLSQEVKEQAFSFAKIIPQKYKELLQSNFTKITIGNIEVFNPYTSEKMNINVILVKNFLIINEKAVAMYDKRYKAIIIAPGHHIVNNEAKDINDPILVELLYTDLLHELTHAIDPNAEKFKEKEEFKTIAEFNALAQEIINEIKKDPKREDEVLLFLRNNTGCYLSFLDNTQIKSLYDLYTLRKDLLKRLKIIIYNEVFANKNTKKEEQ